MSLNIADSLPGSAVAQEPRLLTDEFTPTPLIDPSQRGSIVTTKRRGGTRFRFLFVSFHLSLLLAHIGWLVLCRKADKRSLGTLLRLFCEKMGVLWIKVGQLLSMRTDFLPQEMCQELMKLQDRSHGFPPEEAILTVEQELGGPIDRFFATFERIPFAAASTAQIHRASLKRDNVWVAVKIQRPGIERGFQSDMALVRTLVRLLKWFSIAPYMHWDDFASEIEQIIQEEIDYRYEAANLRRMKKTLRLHKVHVPRVYIECSSQRVLVMEYISGVLMSDYISLLRTEPHRVQAWCEENDVKPEIVGRRLLFSMNRQFYEDQLFHADIHPGNIILLRSSRFAFIDFGCIGFIEKEFLRNYEIFIETLSSGRHAKAADFYLMLQNGVPSKAVPELKAELIRVMENWQVRASIKELPYAERSVFGLAVELTRVTSQYRIAANWDFMRAARSGATLDGSLIALMPDEDHSKLLRKYMEAKNLRVAKKMVRPRLFGSQDASLRNVLLRAIAGANEQIMLRGATLRRLALVFESSPGKLTQCFVSPLLRLLSASILLPAAYLFLVFLYQHSRSWPLFLAALLPEKLLSQIPRLDTQVWLLIFGVLTYAYVTLASLKRKSQEASLAT